MSPLRLLGSLLLLRTLADGTILSVEEDTKKSKSNQTAAHEDSKFSLRSAAVSALRQLEDETIPSLRTAAVDALKQLNRAGSDLKAEVVGRVAPDHARQGASKQSASLQEAGHHRHKEFPEAFRVEPAKAHHGRKHSHAAHSSAKQTTSEEVEGPVSTQPDSSWVTPGKKEKPSHAVLEQGPLSAPPKSKVHGDDIRGVCSGWSPEWGAMKGLGGACKHWGWQTQWCWVPLDYNGPGHEQVEESEEYVGKLFAPCGTKGRGFLSLHGARDHLTRFLIWAPIVFSLAAFGVLVCAVMLRWRTAAATACPKHDPRMRHLWRPSLNKGSPRRDSLRSQSSERGGRD